MGLFNHCDFHGYEESVTSIEIKKDVFALIGVKPGWNSGASTSSDPARKSSHDDRTKNGVNSTRVQISTLSQTASAGREQQHHSHHSAVNDPQVGAVGFQTGFHTMHRTIDLK